MAAAAGRSAATAERRERGEGASPRGRGTTLGGEVMWAGRRRCGGGVAKGADEEKRLDAWWKCRLKLIVACTISKKKLSWLVWAFLLCSAHLPSGLWHGQFGSARFFVGFEISANTLNMWPGCFKFAKIN